MLPQRRLPEHRYTPAHGIRRGEIFRRGRQAETGTVSPGPGRLAALLLIPLLLCVALLGQARGQARGQGQPGAPAQPPAPAPKPPFPAEAQPLLSADLDTWMGGVAALRPNPRARDLLLQAIAAEPDNPRRWRLSFHLIEWGGSQDVGVLESLLDDAEGMERRAALGALIALYPRPATPLDLARVIAEFVFVPQNPAVPFAPEAAGKYIVNDLAIQAYYQENLPLRVIERGMGLKGHAYDSRGALAEAMQKQLQGRQWAEFGERLMAPVSAVPARLSQSGTLQVRLSNPAQRPALLVLSFQCWYGRFEQVPLPRYVLVPPGETVLEEVSVRLIAPAEPGRPRVFVRIQELNAPGQLEAQKLEVGLNR